VISFEKLMAMYEERTFEMVHKSWCLQEKAVRRHRLQTVVALILELEEIKKVDIFSTAFGEQAIEAVIQGDWHEVEEVIEFQTFEAEEPKIRDRYKDLWEKFRIIALTACAEEKRRVTGKPVEAN
jgi:hypothetical protein